MSRINVQRKSCVDVFKAFLVTFAKYAGRFEFPRIKATYEIPNKMISFSKCISSKDFNQWVHFYEDDYLFERVWRNPRRYLDILKRFNGVILPDFSLYRDMPFVMQLWNIYRSRAIGFWLQSNGVTVIPNIRFGDRRTYHICCDGIEKHCVIAIGSHGNLKIIEDRRIFLEGLDSIVKRLQPSTIVVYGSAPEQYFKKYSEMDIKIVRFDSTFAISHREIG
ncbi:MAG: DUF4417 domain-containing protein [Sharpea porci]|uniref:DUF4417 domain-containing protein n=1 Tax=Sharpea porci TaxID=2652286 RepID=UPI0024093905|nr:DUF4417 domain-containing protein [Sharpea porci]MDD6711516.1 DUF4417 domain-containing protein [Sharpea porci]